MINMLRPKDSHTLHSITGPLQYIIHLCRIFNDLQVNTQSTMLHRQNRQITGSEEGLSGFLMFSIATVGDGKMMGV